MSQPETSLAAEQVADIDPLRRFTRSRTAGFAKLLLLAGSAGAFVLEMCYRAAEEDMDGAVRAAWQHGYQAGVTATEGGAADEAEA